MDKIISGLFDLSVSAVVATAEMPLEPYLAEEASFVSNASSKRRLEFLSGRAASRHALKKLGCRESPILVGPNRAPIWPKGYVGSISHCEGLCCAVVAQTSVYESIGIDTEPYRPLPDDIVLMICRQDELTDLRSRLGCGFQNSQTLAFCVKEAFYKCYYQITQTFLDFTDVTVSIDLFELDSGTFNARVINPSKPMYGIHALFSGRWFIKDGFIVTGIGATPAALTLATASSESRLCG